MQSTKPSEIENVNMFSKMYFTTVLTPESRADHHAVKSQCKTIQVKAKNFYPTLFQHEIRAK